MATQDEINTILQLLSTLPGCPITTPETRDLVRSMYFAALGDIPMEWLQAAYLQYIGQDKPFFPSNPGTLREIAFDLELTAQGVPTASQAWAMVMRGQQMIEAQLCEVGGALRRKVEDRHETTQEYFKVVTDYGDHVDKCDVCIPTSRSGSYGSKIVDEAVLLMGGRDTIITDNATADRARFMDAYRELVTSERRKMQMHPQVRALLSDPGRPAIAGEAVKQLTAKMEIKK